MACHLPEVQIQLEGYVVVGSMFYAQHARHGIMQNVQQSLNIEGRLQATVQLPFRGITIYRRADRLQLSINLAKRPVMLLY
jgi:hypothetical protein